MSENQKNPSQSQDGRKDDTARGMKSAYELALERMESQGVERPGELSDEIRGQIAEARQKAEARLAELEIRHRESLAKASSHEERRQENEEYAIDRRRIEEERERKIAEIRGDS